MVSARLYHSAGAVASHPCPAQPSAAIHPSRLFAASQRETYHLEAIIDNLAEGRVSRHHPSLAHILGVDPTRIIGRQVHARSDVEGLRLPARLLEERPGDLRQSCEHRVEIDEPIHAILRLQVSPVLDQEKSWGQIVVLPDETEELNLARARSGSVAAAPRERRPAPWPAALTHLPRDVSLWPGRPSMNGARRVGTPVGAVPHRRLPAARAAAQTGGGGL